MRELDMIPSPVRLWAWKLVARFGFSRIIHAVLEKPRAVTTWTMNRAHLTPSTSAGPSCFCTLNKTDLPGSVVGHVRPVRLRPEPMSFPSRNEREAKC